MQQVAIHLLPDNEEEYEIPETVYRYFKEHLHNLQVGPNGLAFVQNFYTTHLSYWHERRGYLPAELKKCFTAVQQPAGVANRTIDAPPVLQADFSAVKKSKSAVDHGKEPPQKSARLELME